jgi:GT2 family glycosyltransferase
VIIPCWNAEEVLDACLDTLRAQAVPGGFETIVVDDASSDASAAVLARRPEEITLITHPENRGFSAACMSGVDAARGEILFFLNTDTELCSPDVIARLAADLDDPSVGLVGPLLVNADGSLQSSCAAVPSLTTTLLLSSGVHLLLPDRALARVAPHRWSHDSPRDTGWLRGAAIALRADVFRAVGGFSPEYYGQDLDLGYLVGAHGLRVHFDPTVRVMHLDDHSQSQRWSAPERSARVAVAELAFLRRRLRRPRAVAIRAITGTGYAVRAVVHRALGRREPAAVYAAMARVYAGGDV